MSPSPFLCLLELHPCLRRPLMKCHPRHTGLGTHVRWRTPARASLAGSARPGLRHCFLIAASGHLLTPLLTASPVQCPDHTRGPGPHPQPSNGVAPRALANQDKKENGEPRQRASGLQRVLSQVSLLWKLPYVLLRRVIDVKCLSIKNWLSDKPQRKSKTEL